MDVNDLNKAETCRMCLTLFSGKAFTDILPVLLRGSQRMVAVADSEKETVIRCGKEFSQRTDQTVGNRRICFCIVALDMSAVHHEVGVVYAVGCVRTEGGKCRLDDGLFRIFFADTYAGWDTGEHGAFCSTDTALISRSEIILLKIQREDQALTGCIVLRLTVEKDEARLKLGQDAFSDIGADRGCDIGKTLIDLFFRFFFEVNLRKEHAKGRRFVTDSLLDVLPILRFGSELVTCDDGPLGKIEALLRKKDLRCTNGDIFVDKIHGKPPGFANQPQHYITVKCKVLLKFL